MKTRAGRELNISVYKYLGKDNYEEKFHSRDTMGENDPEKKEYYYLHRKPFRKEANIKWTFDIQYQKEKICVNIFDVDVKDIYSSKTFPYGLQADYKLREAFYKGEFSTEAKSYETYMLELANKTYKTIPEYLFDTAEKAKEHIINRFI
jgi:hypothetical protein